MRLLLFSIDTSRIRLAIFLISTSFFCLKCYGQVSPAEKKATKAFQEYFDLQRETLFLHLNKSTYVTGEEIWFKAYIYNKREKLPFEETTNLYVGLYDSIGRQLTKKIFRASKGYADGHIELDSTLNSGNYYIKASTNWMRNFKDDGAYVQNIKIYQQGESISPRISGKSDYDLQFLPEGGRLIAGIKNNIGVKCVDIDGYGAKFIKGIVKDSENKLVNIIEPTASGMTSFVLEPKNGLTYSAEITFENGSVKTFPLPLSTDEGYNVNLVDKDSTNLQLTFGRGSTTKLEKAQEDLILWVSKDGLVKKLDIQFAKGEDYSLVTIDKESLFKGMNVLTLLDQHGRPILERLYFNHKTVSSGTIEISDAEILKDSIAITLKGKFDKSKHIQLSISVLPKATMAYDHDQNILSTFLLSPYLKGHIENPSYYFKEVTKSKIKELDVLLLTQGWSKYDWEELYGGPIQIEFPFERGIELFGKIQSDIKSGDKLMVYPFDDFQGSAIALHPDSTEFSIKGLFPTKGQAIRLSILDDRGSIKKPKMYLSARSNMVTDRLANIPGEVRPNNWADNNVGASQPINLFQDDEPVELDEVTVSAEKNKRRFTTPFVFENKLTKVTDKTAKMYPGVLDLLRNNGFSVIISYEPKFDRVQIKSLRNRKYPVIYIDDVRLMDLDRLLYDYPLSRLDSYYISRSGDGESGAAGGVIRIYTKESHQLEDTSAAKTPKDRILVYNTPLGFESVKSYYSPKYGTSGNTFQNFGVVHWVSSMSLRGNESKTFKVPKTDAQGITLFIEGMGKNGTLISTTLTIP